MRKLYAENDKLDYVSKTFIQADSKEKTLLFYRKNILISELNNVIIFLGF